MQTQTKRCSGCVVGVAANGSNLCSLCVSIERHKYICPEMLPKPQIALRIVVGFTVIALAFLYALPKLSK